MLRSSTAGPITRVALYNPFAGSSWRTRRMQRVVDALAALPGTMVVPTRAGEITAQVRELLRGDVTSVFACGGDGTVSDVAAGVAGTGATLGIIPCGTTNTLAYDLGIPQDPLRAVAELAVSSATRAVRTWTVNGAHRLMLGVGVGWDARLMWRTPPALKRRLGYFAFTPMGVALALRYEFPALEVTGTDDAGREVRAAGSSVLISNSRHWAGARRVFPAADLTSDALQVMVLERPSLAQLVPFWLNMQLPGGRPLGVDRVRVLAMRSVHVTAPGGAPVEAHVNGDPVAETPLVIEPSDHVKVLVPD